MKTAERIQNWARVAVFCLLCLLVSESVSGALDVPLKVKECAGVGAAHYPVCAVIPLPKGRFGEAGDLGIAGVPSQVEVLERWPGDRSLRHVAVHFLADVSALGEAEYRFTDTGRLAPPKPLQVVEDAERILLDTGPMRLKILKRGFNVLDGLWRDEDGDGRFTEDERIVAQDPRNGGGLQPRAGAGEIQYGSTRGDVQVTLEASGPLRATLRAEAPARFRGTTDHLHGFCVRIHVYAGLSLLFLTYQIQNSDKTVVRSWPLYLESLDVGFSLANMGPLMATIGTGTPSPFKTAVGTGLRAAQEMHDRFRVLSIPTGAQLYDSGDMANGTGPEGFLDLADSRRGLMAAMRDFWQTWPNGLAYREGRLSFEIFPDWSAQWSGGAFSPSGLYWVEDMQHVTKDMLLSPHAGDTPDSALVGLARTFQYPPVAVVPTDWYRTSRATLDLGGILPPEASIPAAPDRRLPDYTAEGFAPEDWYNATGPYYGVGWMNFGDPEPGYRSVSCTPGGWPYSGAHLVATGNPADFFEAQAHATGERNLRPEWMAGYTHEEDWAALRLTDNPYCGGRWRIFEGHGVSKLAAPPLPGTGEEQPVYYSRDDQHGWFYHVADAWFLTGDPWIRDWYRFVGEFRKVRLERLEPFPDTSSRATGHSLHHVIQAARITGDEDLLDLFGEHLRRYLRPEQDPLYGDQRESVESTGGGFQTGYLMRAVVAYLEEVAAREDWDAYAQGFAYLSGLVTWNLHHGNFPYYFNAREGGTGVSSGTGLTLVDPVAWYYWHTGNREVQEHLLRYVREGINGGERPYGNFETWEGQFEGRVYLFVRDTPRFDTLPPAPVTDLALTEISPGLLRASWGIPEGAKRFHLVWGDRPIVEAPSRDPALLNWWAAETTGVPAAGTAGATQTLEIVTGAGGSVYAALFSFDEGENMSGISNLAVTGGTPLRTLTVEKAGSGEGRVEGADGKIACGTVCTGVVAQGSAVTLQAFPEEGSVLASWSGCDGVDQEGCHIVVDEDATVIAEFARAALLTVVRPNGGERWKAGRAYLIRWRFEGEPGTRVRVDLLKGEVLDRTLAEGVATGRSGGGFFFWRIPSDQTPGADYAVRISDTEGLGAEDPSDACFEIVGH